MTTPHVGSRVWAIGDWMTDGTSQAAGFDDDAMLPFGGAGTPPPRVVPVAPAKLPTPTASASAAAMTVYTTATFDVSRDGKKVAFLADTVTTGRYDLYVADADGSAPVLLASATATAEIQALAISPDGTKVAFLQDATVDGGYDLYVVDTTGTGTPVQVSPARPAPINLEDVFFQVTWSADSRYLAFSGDLTSDGFDQAYCADTSTSPPTTATLLAKADIAQQPMGAQGVRGNLLFDHADNVYFRARVVVGTPSQFQLFQAAPDGSARADITALAPARGDASTPDIGAFAISPDGTKLVFSADAPAAFNYDIYALTIGDTQTTKLTNLPGTGTSSATVRADFNTPMWFSPDGKRIAYVANFQSARREPYVSKLDGSSTTRLVSALAACSGCTSPDADLLQWGADNTTIFAQGDLTANNDTKLYKLDAQMTDQTPVLALDVPTNGDMTLSVVRPK